VTTDRHTHRQTDASDFIICPMLCYSNGTDKNVTKKRNIATATAAARLGASFECSAHSGVNKLGLC